MSKHLRVNLRAPVVNADIRKEKRNGREVMVVPSATLPDGVVMNKIMYTSEAIQDGYQTLNRTPAPLGHPMVNGQYVSAMTPEAINGFWVGAWNENVRRENGRVFLDKIIDVETARGSGKGRDLLAAIEQGEPISTSTGLMLTLSPAPEGTTDYDWVTNTIEADHDAILLNEKPAASTEQGVGIFVNAKGEEIPVENAELTTEALQELAETIADDAVRTPLVNKIMDAIRGVMSMNNQPNEGTALSVNTKEGDDMSDEKLDALAKQVEALAANALTKEDLTETVKPLNDAVAELQANAKAADEAKKSELVAKVVRANLFTEDEAKELSVNHLQKLADKIQPGQSEGVFGAYNTQDAPDEGDISDELPGGEAA